MEGEKDSAVLWCSRGFGRSDRGAASSIPREQGSGEAQCPSRNGQSCGRCSSGGEDPSAGPQEKSQGVAYDNTPVRYATTLADGRDLHIYETGGKREGVEERFDLVPPVGLSRVAAAMNLGATKYGELNWHGLPASNCINHAIRHLYLHLSGDDTEDHLGHAAANILMSIDLEDRDGGSTRRSD